MYFRCFVIIYSWKRACFCMWITLTSLSPRMLSAKFGWNFSSGSALISAYSPWTYNSFTPWCHVLTTPPFPWWRLWRLVYSAVIWACLFCLHTTITAQVATCMLIIHDYNNDFTWFQFFCTMIKIIYCSKIWPFSISHAFAFIYSLQVFQI